MNARNALVEMKLHRLKADRLKRISQKAETQLVRPGQLAVANVIAVDQSLAATGVVLLANSKQGLSIVESTTLKTDMVRDKPGVEDDLQRALHMVEIVSTWLTDQNLPTDRWSVVHEAVPEGFGQMRHPNSSLLTAFVWRLCAHQLGFPLHPPVPARAHKKLLCANPNAEKKEHHAAVKGFMKNNVKASELVTNESQRDALSVGIYDLFRSRRVKP